MADEERQAQPGAQREYHTVGGLGNFLMGKVGGEPEDTEEVIEGEPETEPEVEEFETPENPPQVIPQETIEPEPQQGEAQIERYTYTKPDGSEGVIELSTDPNERARQIASMASGKDAYLAGREISKAYSPELGDKWYELMKNQTEIMRKMDERQESQQKSDPTSVLTEQQREHYDYLIESGDDRGAQTYLKSTYATNMMMFDAMKKVEEMEEKLEKEKEDNLRQEAIKGFYRNVDKYRTLYPELPDPNYNGDAFYQALMQKLGGFLRRQGFSDQQILFGHIDIETLDKAYKLTNPNATQQGTGKRGQTSSQATANDTVSPEVLRQVRDMSGGGAKSAIGNEPDDSKIAQATSRRDLRELDKDGGVSNSFINAMFSGDVAEYISRRRAAKKPR